MAYPRSRSESRDQTPSSLTSFGECLPLQLAMLANPTCLGGFIQLLGGGRPTECGFSLNGFTVNGSLLALSPPRRIERLLLFLGKESGGKPRRTRAGQAGALQSGEAEIQRVLWRLAEGNIIDLGGQVGRSPRWPLGPSGRKVRTLKGSVLANGQGVSLKGWLTESATENIPPR